MPSFINKALRSAKKASHAVGFVLGLKDTFPTPAVSVTVSVQRTSLYSTTAATKYEYVYKYEEDDNVVDNKWSVVTGTQSLMAAATIIEAREKAIGRAMYDIRKGEVAVCRGMAHIKAREKVIGRIFASARECERAVEIREKIVDHVETRMARERDVEIRGKALEIREKISKARERASKCTEISVEIRERAVETHTKAAKRAVASVKAHKKAVNRRIDSVETREKALEAHKEAVKAREKTVERTIACIKKHEKVVYRVMACFGECEEAAERTFGRIEPASSTAVQPAESADINSVMPVPDVFQASDVSPNTPEEILGSLDTSAPIENMTERSKQARQTRARLEMALEAL
ncbi:hypothetical protein GGI19_003627 [Coemansia pectinata]|uniref:Uncharacterized protein n=1 Tax=Coemansia pectinata TaxID=1052879 RepID=A0A9W8L966_9FUNG|nr:hypothetical protein GGI19_003627 [Coemansia pectinata]